MHLRRNRSAAPKCRLGPIESLEPRLLLATNPHARIVNGDLVSGLPLGIVNGVPTEQFSAVGMVGDRSMLYCSGTLISSRFVLTAGHCAEGLRATQGRFSIGGSVYSSSAVYVHPNYNGGRIGVSDAANDIALLELSVAVVGVTPDPIFRGMPHVSDVLTLVGFGAGGTGTTGHDGSFGEKRAGTTPIDNVTQRRVLWNFDNNQESNTAPGDSGGPAYLLVNGTYYIAGITSGGDRADAAIGDHSYDTRVDYYVPWIDSIVGSAGSTSTGSDPGTGPSADDHANAPGSDATAMAVGLDGVFHGSGQLEVAGDRDVFQVSLSERGTVSLDLASGDGTLDTYLRVYDSAGNLIAVDDDSGPATDSHVSMLLGPGVYYVSAGAFNDAASGVYELDGRFSLDDHADSFVGATHLAVSSNGSGSAAGAIGEQGDRDMFRLDAPRNGHIIFDLTGSGGLDPVLTVFDRRGRVIGINDDSYGTPDSHLLLRVRAGATYYIQAAGFQTSLGDYSLKLTGVLRSRQAVSRSAADLPAIIAAIDGGHRPGESVVDSAGPSQVYSESSLRHSEELHSDQPRIDSRSFELPKARPNVTVLDHVIADGLGDALQLV